MAANVNLNQQPINAPSAQQAFMDKHFAKIAFSVSTLALFILSPLFLLLGTVAGLGLHHSLIPNLIVRGKDKVITLPNTVFAIVGAAASVLTMTPAGAAGGFVFQAIPLVFSMAIGSTVYRALKSC